MDKLIAQIGTIDAPAGVAKVTGDPSSFIAGFIQAGISLMLIIAFIVALFFTIFAGFRFLTSGGDPKSTGQAWSQIYMGLLGMIVVLGSYAIIRLIETFFNVAIISGGFQLPSRP